MAKRSVIQRALKGARGVMRNYVRPGAKTAEDTSDDLLKTLGSLRTQLAAERKRFGGGRKRKSAKRASASRRGAVKRKVKQAVTRRKKRA
jgi:hypothetical protein